MPQPPPLPDPFSSAEGFANPSTEDYPRAQDNKADEHTLPPQAGAVPQGLPAPPGHEILEVIGHGGQSLVYKARHQATNRLVALKMLRDGMLALPEHQARLRREAQALARLQHLHIVQIYEVGSHQGQPFMALEYVAGGSLEARRKEWPIPPAAAAQLVKALAKTMDFVHDQGIVHRDLKPANILLVGAGGTLSAVSEDPDTIDLATYRGPRNTLQFKISDFGLAKQTDDSTSLTNTGAIMGSTSYMAPEQADGRTKQATRAMDIYALGIILYDLLTGKPPFTGPLLEVLEKIKNQPPPPLPSNVPPALARICLRCLEKKPERRFTTAAELAEALANYRDQPNNAPSFAYKPEPVLTLPGHQDQVSQVHFAASGQQLWSASHDCSEILYWDFTDETDRLSLPSHMTGVATFAVSDDEKWMMTCTLAGTLRLFDLQAEELVRRFDELSYPTRSVTFAPNSTWALTGDREGFLRLWDVPTGVHLLRKRGHKGAISTVVFAPNGEYFASGGEDCRLCLWRARTGESIRPQGSSFSFPQKYPICKICFSSDSKLIAFCDASDVIHIWEVASGRTVQQIRGHQLKAGELTVSDTVGGIVFSPDGRFLLSTGHDRTLRIWSVETGEECHRFTHDSDHFCCLAISRDGHYAATGSLQGPVRLWRLPELDSFHQKS